mmetsp:Transcript_89613/g.248894  ORF Transcript_89613/g.248894 Transcript_89613/m.248894 type:complete len:332 (-) Transcript_89613:568-1563(-)
MQLAHKGPSEPKPPSNGTTGSKDGLALPRDGASQWSEPRRLPGKREDRLLTASLGALLTKLLDACDARGSSAAELVVPWPRCCVHPAERVLPAEQREASDVWSTPAAGPALASAVACPSSRSPPPPWRQAALALLQWHSAAYTAPAAGLTPGPRAASRTSRFQALLTRCEVKRDGLRPPASPPSELRESSDEDILSADELAFSSSVPWRCTHAHRRWKLKQPGCFRVLGAAAGLVHNALTRSSARRVLGLSSGSLLRRVRINCLTGSLTALSRGKLTQHSKVLRAIARTSFSHPGAAKGVRPDRAKYSTTPVLKVSTFLPYGDPAKTSGAM